jgi:hypothetical protein
VNLAIRVLDRVIDDRVFVVRFQPIVGEQFIGEDCGASLYVIADVSFEDSSYGDYLQPSPARFRRAPAFP